VGPGIGLDDVEKRKFLTLPGLERRNVRSKEKENKIRGGRRMLRLIALAHTLYLRE
jgi:hypothetical protein